MNSAIYIHPQTPPPNMVMPYPARGFERAIMGFAHETSLHILGLIASGVFDRFPKLKIVIGHGGEGLPFMLYRIDYMYENARYPFMKKIQKHAQRLYEGKQIHHDKRLAVGAGDYYVSISFGLRSSVVCNGLSVSIRCRRGGHDG